ncbi:MAG: oligosaccharide flippase family protein [Pirellulales bacterium]|nr:oligosaccharide flippase family protein [Pirellulales bacterium]
MRNLNIKTALYRCCPGALRPVWDRIEASELGYRLAKGAFWSLAGAVISRGLMLLAFILVARLLGKEVFGELGIIRSTAGMFGIFAGFGLGMTTTKHVAELRSSDPERAGRIIALSNLVAVGTGCLISLLLFVFAPWLAAHTLNAPALGDPLRVGCLLVLLNTLNGVQTGTLAGFEAFKTIARVNFFAGLVSFPILVGAAIWGGLPATIWGLVVTLAVQWTINHLSLRQVAARASVPLRFRGCTREWAVLWHFSLPAALSGIMVGPASWCCAAMLVNQPTGYAEMGIFDAANQWRMAILFIPVAVGQIALPVLANLNDSEDRSKFRKVFKYNLLLNSGVATAVAVPIAILAPWIMASYGPGFEGGVMALVLLVFTSVLMSVNSAIGQVIASKGKMWAGFFLNALWASALLLFAWLLIDRGATGLALAFLMSYGFHSFNVFIYSRRLTTPPTDLPEESPETCPGLPTC